MLSISIVNIGAGQYQGNHLGRKNILEDTTLVIMAGGQSKRFGSNKALAKWDGEPLIQRIIRKVSQVTDNLVLSVREQGAYDWLDIPKVVDLVRGAGPMGGLYSCLKALDTEKIFLVACDMPLVCPELIEFMINLKCQEPVVIPVANGRKHPLHARYHRCLFPIVEKLIMDGRYKMKELLDQVPVRTVTQKDLLDESIDVDMSLCLSNVNTQEEFKQIKAMDTL